MRAWTKSACVVLAWTIVAVIGIAAAMNRSAAPAQANTRIASSTKIIFTSTPGTAAAAPVTAAARPARYVVRRGDTLAAIAARFAVRGGWSALYAANRRAIGPDPALIQPGTVLALPGRAAPAHYTVAPGDTLSGIAAEFAVRGGWPALYAANRRAIGPDPGLIQAGTVLTLPRPAAPPATARKAAAQQAGVRALEPGTAGSGPACWRAGALRAQIVVADYHRLVVTRSKPDDTIYVLRPPGEDPRAILRVARVVLPEGPYGELAKQLGMPAIGPVE